MEFNTSMQYMDYVQPSFAPPSSWFGPVWTFLYMLIAISFGYVFYKTYTKEISFMVALPFMLNLVFKTNLNILEIKIALLSNYQINYDVNYLMSPIVLNWIENNKNRFTHIYLVSASPDFFIKKVLKNQQLFDDIYNPYPDT